MNSDVFKDQTGNKLKGTGQVKGTKGWTRDYTGIQILLFHLLFFFFSVLKTMDGQVKHICSPVFAIFNDFFVFTLKTLYPFRRSYFKKWNLSRE